MALSGLAIYKHLPKTNCKKCGFATCLAFAMQMAAKKVSLDQCPDVSAEAKAILGSASQPPIKLVTVGSGDNKIEIGNETVMFRHEQKFFHQPGVGFLLEDTMSEADLLENLARINDMVFERVGRMIRVDVVCLKHAAADKSAYTALVRTVREKAVKMNILLYSLDVDALKEALTICKGARPLVVGAEKDTVDAYIGVAKEHSLPMAVTVNSLDDAAELADKVKSAGVEEVVLDIQQAFLPSRIENFTLARRMALRKNFRALGFPLLSISSRSEKYQEIAEAASYVAKYSGLVIMKRIEKDVALPVLVTRQDIYTDPQKPVQVESKVYEVGKVTKQSPVIITTNFSITYYTVLGEVESSKVPSYIIPCDTEGMSVLTAWAAEKFTAETIAAALKKFNVESLVSHRNLTIPGYVAVLSGSLEEEAGWKVNVGPKEASGIPNYLKSLN